MTSKAFDTEPPLTEPFTIYLFAEYKNKIDVGFDCHLEKASIIDNLPLMEELKRKKNVELYMLHKEREYLVCTFTEYRLECDLNIWGLNGETVFYIVPYIHVPTHGRTPYHEMAPLMFTPMQESRRKIKPHDVVLKGYRASASELTDELGGTFVML